MTQFDLHTQSWTLAAVGDLSVVPAPLRDALAAGLPATVPGCVHTDLLAAGLIDDPYLDRNELQLTWIGRTDWRYTCRFNVDETLLSHDRIDLACDGLDTVANVALNDQVIGHSENMHVALRFDATAALRHGANELTITFASPLAYAEAMEQRLGALPHNGHGANPPLPHNMIRKMPCNFGWDWGPALITSGIWRPIRLEAWNTARLAQVRPLITRADAQHAVVKVHLDVQTAAGGDASVRLAANLTDPDGNAHVAAGSEGRDALVFDIADPQRWWPVGHGEQPLYDLRVILLDDAGGELDVWTGRIGLRTVELITEPDEQPFGEPVPDAQGATFHLRVNGKPIYCKGANWIPDDCFPHRISRERYRQRIEQVREANMNMLRVWGGGIYESHDFYELCDERGIMVWQDFLFACACYSEEQPMTGLVEAEARDNIVRLCRHPSLVIWNGCNENIWGTFVWGELWRRVREEGKRTWGLGYYLDLLPRLLAQLDPTRPYWPASPYSGSMDIHPNANEYGNRHIWDVWHGPGDYRNYLAHYPRMASEFGFHGPPCWPTLERSIPPDQRYWDSPAMRHHNKNGQPDRDGQKQSNERMADDFVPPTEPDRFDDWLYLAQVMQARALTMGVEWFRCLFPWNYGALLWQHNDCWPVASWSAIDGDGRPKPLWYAARRFFAPRLVSIKPRRAVTGEQPIGPLAVYLHNDDDRPWAGTLSLRRMTLDGQMLDNAAQPVDIQPRQLHRVLVPEHWHDRDDALLVAELAGQRGLWFFDIDRRLDYPEPRFDADMVRTDTGLRLTLHAHTLLRDLCLFADRLDPEAIISDQGVTLLPGESFTFEITTGRSLHQADLLTPPVLQCVNRFGRNATPAPTATVAGRD